jgi:hypothetical protein
MSLKLHHVFASVAARSGEDQNKAVVHGLRPSGTARADLMKIRTEKTAGH